MASSSTAEEKIFQCPACFTSMSKKKELQRHWQSKCDVQNEYRCPSCTSGPFYRRDHFQKHHRTSHACSAGTCTHADNYRFRLEPRDFMGCGICSKHFSDYKKFINHIGDHFSHGKTLAQDWTRSQEVKSLLRQDQVRYIWDELVGVYLMDLDRRPDVQWSQEITDHFIPFLERMHPENLLRRELRVLANATIQQTVSVARVAQQHQQPALLPGYGYHENSPATTLPYGYGMPVGTSTSYPAQPPFTNYQSAGHANSYGTNQTRGMANYGMDGSAYALPPSYPSTFDEWYV